MFNYIGTLRHSSSINHSITCNFLNAPSKLNLILTKSNILEIYNITQTGLEPTPYLNIYGTIILLESIPSQTEPPKDNLFLLTEDLDYSIISSRNNQIINLIKGSIKEDIGKKQDQVLYAMNKDKSVMIISAYHNIFKIINLNVSNSITSEREKTIRYDYDELLYLVPFYPEQYSLSTGTNNKNSDTHVFTFGVIKTTIIDNDNTNRQDNFHMINEGNINTNTMTTNVISFETFQLNTLNNSIVTYQQHFKIGNFVNQTAQDNKNNALSNNIHFQYIDLTSNPTISLIISSSNGYIVIFFSNVVKYYKVINNKLTETDKFKTYTDRKFVNYCIVDEIQNKYCVCDEYGDLFLFAIQDNNKELILQFLGEISYSSCLTYLDANYLFVGSSKANSQLIKVLLTPKENDTKRPFIEIVEEYESLAPISDFTVINNSKEENSVEILTVSGTDKNCAIKNIRKGTSLIFDCEIPFQGLLSVYKIKYLPNSGGMLIDSNENDYQQYRTCLICSKINKSYAFDIEGTYTLTLNNNISFANNERALYACNIQNDNILIVTNVSLSIYNEYLELKTTHNFTEYRPLIIKYHRKNQCVYLYTNNRTLYCFDINLNKTSIILENIDITAFDISQYFIIYSLWNENNIYIYSIHTGCVNVFCNIDENTNDVLISSIQIIKKEGIKFVFVSLSNGKMMFFKLKQQFRLYKTHSFSGDDFIYKRKYNISSDNFEIFKNEGSGNSSSSFSNTSCLFISTTIPSFIYINKENPIISNFNIKYCKDIIKIKQNGIFAFIFNDHIAFGSLSNTQSQNVLTKKYNYQIHNLKQITLNIKKNIPFVLMTLEQEVHTHFILSDINMNEISRYTLDYEHELCTSIDIIHSNQNDVKLIILGTGISDNMNSEPEYGHLYLMEINSNTYKIRKVKEIETKGGVFKLAVSKQNTIFVSIGPTLYIYQLIENAKYYDIKLIRRCNEFSAINDLTFLNEYLCISDVYRSVALYNYDIEKEKLTEISRDYNPSWIMSAIQCNESMMYLSDIDGNIISLKSEFFPKSDEEKYKLERKALINLGERINKLYITKLQGKDLKDISIIDKDTDEVDVVYYGTLEGSLGVIIQIKKEIYELLYMLQKHILKKVFPNGGFEYNKWREYKDGFVYENMKGFVEGSVLAEFLNFDDEYRKEFLKEVNYPWQKNIGELINIIETLLKYH